jgi:hypothetical protein
VRAISRFAPTDFKAWIMADRGFNTRIIGSIFGFAWKDNLKYCELLEE